MGSFSYVSPGGHVAHRIPAQHPIGDGSPGGPVAQRISGATDFGGTCLDLPLFLAPFLTLDGKSNENQRIFNHVTFTFQKIYQNQWFCNHSSSPITLGRTEATLGRQMTDCVFVFFHRIPAKMHYIFWAPNWNLFAKVETAEMR